MATNHERTDEQERRSTIHAAAIAVFSAQGFAATSMADIATAAGISRPALYQYFANKRDIFASAFAALIDESVDRALAALKAPGSVAEQLDGLLQRFDGDLWEGMAASAHSEEILQTKNELAVDPWAPSLERLHKGLAAYVRRQGATRARSSEWTDLLELSPKGFKIDRPSVATYRRRLTALANGVAAALTASSG